MNYSLNDRAGHVAAVFPNSRRAPRFPGRRRRGWPAFILLLFAGRAAAALTVAPSSVTNAYNGALDLTVTGLNNPGQTVIVEKYFDVNASGTINSGDLLIQRFKVTDGQVTSIGGHRNFNVPGDEDGSANGTIHTKLYLTPEEILGRLDGLYIFRISPDGAGFSPFTGNLTVTQLDYGGSAISGRVMGSSAAQARAIVMMTIPSGGDFDVAGITIANASGNYSLKLPPKVYRPVAIKTGFVFNTTTGPQVTVSAGLAAASPDAVLTASTRTIAGLVREDAGTHPVLPALGIFGQSQSGMFSFTLSDASGAYVLDAIAGRTDMGVVEQELPLLGMTGTSGFRESSAGSVTGFNLDFPKATALIYGTLKTPSGTGIPLADVSGETGGGAELTAAGFTNEAGNYSLAVTPGNWAVRTHPANHLVPESTVIVSAAGSATLLELTGYPITAHLRGQVKNEQGAPVGGLEILAQDYLSASSTGVTGPNGDFDIGVYGGVAGASKKWSLQLNQGGDEPAAYVGPVIDYQVMDNADINAINYVVYGVTAHLRGHVFDDSNVPLGGFGIYASKQTNGFLSGSNVAGDGSFDIPVFGGSWSLGLSDIAGLGILPQNNLPVSVTDNVDQNGLVFRARTASGTFSGTVKNSQGTGLGGVQVYATLTAAGSSFFSAGITDSSGSYSMPAFAGTWSLNVRSGDLQSLGYQPTASQDAAMASGAVTVNFVATNAGQTFASWKAAKFTPAETSDPAVVGPLVDFDHDGIVNLMEYALHLEPKFRDSGGLPVPGILPGGPGGLPWATLTFHRLAGQSGLTYTVQESSGLSQAWTSVAAAYEVLSSDGTVETVRARAPASAGGRNFLRLQVVQTAP